MKILLFGATGGTGTNILTQGLKEGHQITAFVRDSKKLSIKDPHLSIIQGDVLNTQDVQEAITGHDIVISVLGNKTSDALWKPNTIISDGVRNILAGMKMQNVKRLLFVASFGVNEEIFFLEKIFIRVVLKNLFADIPLQEEMIKESDLDWTLIHPARLVNTPRTGIYKIGETLSINPFSKISRADVADFLLKNIEDPRFIHKTVTISY